MSEPIEILVGRDRPDLPVAGGRVDAVASEPRRGAQAPVTIVWFLDGARLIGTCAAPPGTRQALAVYDSERRLGRVEIAVDDDGSAAWQFWLPMELIDGEAHAIALRLSNGALAPARDGRASCRFCQTVRSTIDHYTDGVITGWAYDVTHPAESLVIALFDGDRLVANGRAAMARPDVNAHFGIPGDHGFAIPVPRRLFDGRAHDLRLMAGDTVLRCAADTAIPQWLSPPTLGAADRPTQHFAGRVEHVDVGVISGWAANMSAPYRPVEVGVVVDGIVEEVVRADEHRPHLAALTGSGYHGFAIALPVRLMNGAAREFELRILADGTLLPFPDGPLHALVDCPLIDVFGAQAGPPPGRVAALPARAAPAIQPWRRRGRPRVSLIVLNRNGAALLQGMLASLVAIAPEAGIEVLVVDHGSSDDSRAVARSFAGAIDLTVLARENNDSFSASNNWAARRARGDFLFFVNNDIVFTEPCIQRLAAWLDADAGLGAVGMRLEEPRPAGDAWRTVTHHAGIHLAVDRAPADALASDPAATPSPSSVPSVAAHRPLPAADQAAGIYRPLETGEDGLSSRLCRARGGCDVPAVTAAAMMVRRRDFLVLGGFDEGYCYGHEDVDFCLRLRSDLGMAVIADTGLSALHHRSATRRDRARPPDDGVQARQDANRRRLEGRFSPRLRRTVMQSLIETGPLWRRQPLRVVFAVTEAGDAAAAGDFFTARELGEALRNAFGWEVLFARYTTADLPGADVVVVMRHDFDLPGLARVNPGAIMVAWLRNRVDQWLAAPGFAGYHVVLASSRQACERVAVETGRRPVLMPIATNPVRFHPGREPLGGGCAIVFTGNYWGEPRLALEQVDLAHFGPRLAIYGHGWQGHPRWGRYWRGPLPYDEVARAYAGARIIIDDSHPVAGNWASLNARVFDGLAAGALVLTNCAAGAAEIFGDALPTFSSGDELNTLIARYLDNEDERQALVERLRARVLREHDYRQRAPVLRAALAGVARALRIAVKIAVPDPMQRETWGDWHFACGLKRALERRGCQVRVDCLPEWSCGVGAGDDVNIVLRGLSAFRPVAGMVNLAWLISHPDCVADDAWAGFDHVFVASRPYAVKLAARLGDRVSVLLQCTDPEVFHPALAPVTDLPAALFVGNTRGVERPMLHHALSAGIDCAVIGDGWEGRVPPDRWLAPSIPNRELFRYYGADSIVLADHWPDMAREGFLSNRLFDAGACGAAVISDAVADLEAVFGDTLCVCHSPDSLRRIVEGLNADPARRRALGQALRERVVTQHTFDVRAEAIMATIGARLEPIPWNAPHTEK